MNQRRSTSWRRRGSGSGTYSWLGGRAVWALAAVANIAAVPRLYADPIRFDNPPVGYPEHFDWPAGPLGTSIWLDITQPAGSQVPGTSGSTKVRQVRPDEAYGALYGGAPSFELVVQSVASAGYFLRAVEYEPFVGFDPGLGEVWNRGGFIYHGDDGSLLPESSPVYLGLRFDPGWGDGLHYGWVGVERYGASLDAFAWGYETEPAGSPEPDTLTLLAFLATAAMARRSRGGRVRPTVD